MGPAVQGISVLEAHLYSSPLAFCAAVARFAMGSSESHRRVQGLCTKAILLRTEYMSYTILQVKEAWDVSQCET
jgi:hypothetical protein